MRHDAYAQAVMGRCDILADCIEEAGRLAAVVTANEQEY
jgi:hypothetical protein